MLLYFLEHFMISIKSNLLQVLVFGIILIWVQIPALSHTNYVTQ